MKEENRHKLESIVQRHARQIQDDERKSAEMSAEYKRRREEFAHLCSTVIRPAMEEFRAVLKEHGHVGRIDEKQTAEPGIGPTVSFRFTQFFGPLPDAAGLSFSGSGTEVSISRTTKSSHGHYKTVSTDELTKDFIQEELVSLFDDLLKRT